MRTYPLNGWVNRKSAFDAKDSKCEKNLSLIIPVTKNLIFTDTCGRHSALKGQNGEQADLLVLLWKMTHA